MGNFSRGDTFDPLKRYVSVRLQQGVPLVDADWNEMDDIRRTELRTFIKWFIGDGIPDKSDAFRIAAMPTPDSSNFMILAGGGNDGSGAQRCLVEGVEVFITQEIEFTAQPLHADYTGPTPPIAPDATPVDPNAPKIVGIPTTAGSYLVYLDVWEWEVGASEDNAHLVNPLLGVETCVRLKRSWVIRVFQAGSENRLLNHSYYLLATIDRPIGSSTITPEQITDRRRTELNLSKYLKSPVYIEYGSTVIDNQVLVALFTQISSALRNRLASQSLFTNAAPSDLGRTLVHFALQDIVQVCSTLIVQARTNNLNNADSIQALLTLAEAQETFLATLDQHGNPSDAAKTNFINNYRRRLNELKNEVVNSNLIKVYLAQKDIANWLSVGSEAAKFLSDNWNSLLGDAVSRLAQSEVILSSERNRAEFSGIFTGFLRDPIVESCQLNSPQPFDAVLPDLDGFRSSGWPYISTLQEMKNDMENRTGLSNDAKILVATFFDYAINALS